MKKTAAILLALSVTLGAPAAVSALSFEFGPKLGYTVPTGGFDDAAGDGFAWGAYLGYYVRANAFLELAYLRHRHDLVSGSESFGEVTDGLQAGLSEVDTIDLKMHEIAVSGKYLFSRGAFTPYLTAGAGAYIWEIEVEGLRRTVETSETTSTGSSGTSTTTTTSTTTGGDIARSWNSTDFGLSGGGGVRFMVTGELSLGAEATYTYVFGDFDNGYVNVLGTLSYAF